MTTMSLRLEEGSSKPVIPTMRRTPSVLSAFWLSALVVVWAIPLASQITSSTSESPPPDLDLILQRMRTPSTRTPLSPGLTG
jgi:hypothetical protein